jgi:hypothetical protein
MQAVELLMKHQQRKASWWMERLAAALGIGGVVVATLSGYHVHAAQESSSDFKTLYASGKLFLRGVDAYNFPNIETVFRQFRIVIPVSWYAHAPTYPPFTFALLAPIIALPMAAAVYVWFFISAISLVVAIWAMADTAERSFGLNRWWRLLLIVLTAAAPIVSFGLEVNNVCVASAALCIIAVMYAEDRPSPWLALMFAASMLLKPHMALCLLLGMILSRNRIDRSLALRSLAWFAGALALVALLFFHRQLGLQLAGYTVMVQSEIATGCLNPYHHELVWPACQVTSLQLLLGYGMQAPWMQVANVAGLLLLGGALLYATRKEANNQSDTRLEVLGAWSTLGLLATYHRTDDGILLFMMFPWMLARWRRNLTDPIAWGVLLLLVLGSFGSYPPTFDWVAHLGLPALAQFLVFRQSALATLALMCLLLAHLLHHGRSRSLLK